MATYAITAKSNFILVLLDFIVLIRYADGNGYFPRDCGKCPVKSGGSCVEVQSRIVGGREATRGSFPWQVLVEHQEGGNCGGAIVNKEWVITTAHCFYTRT